MTHNRVHKNLLTFIVYLTVPKGLSSSQKWHQNLCIYLCSLRIFHEIQQISTLCICFFQRGTIKCIYCNIELRSLSKYSIRDERWCLNRFFKKNILALTEIKKTKEVKDHENFTRRTQTGGKGKEKRETATKKIKKEDKYNVWGRMKSN
jgi:hypothetical protein